MINIIVNKKVGIVLVIMIIMLFSIFKGLLLCLVLKIFKGIEIR